MTDALKQFVNTANARADADTFKAGAKVMAEHFDAETARLREALQQIKNHCAGDAFPRWDKGPRTTTSRGLILDLCDGALGNIR